MGCKLHAPVAENHFDEGSSGLRKLRARDTKFGTWVHLDKAYLAPYEERGWDALCTCSARASVLNASFSRGPEGHTGGTTDPNLAGRTHTVPT